MKVPGRPLTVHAFQVAKKRKKKSRSPARPGVQHPPESRAAEAVTIMWSLCMLATTVALVVMVLSDWMVPSVPNAEGAPSLIHVLPDLLLFMASVTGTLCIVMTWPVHRLRKTKPPLAVTLYALSISVMPLLFALGGNWWRR